MEPPSAVSTSRLEAARCNTTDVEGTHRELRARLADGLGRDDADGVANLRDLVGRRIDAIGFRVDATLGDRCQRRHDLDALDAEFVDPRCHFLGH
jgi:hypothetical protein